jgi:hypothetical protein
MKKKKKKKKKKKCIYYVTHIGSFPMDGKKLYTRTNGL